MRGLEWSYNDQLLVSCGGDGAVYQWKLKHFKRAKESVLKARARCLLPEKAPLACMLRIDGRLLWGTRHATAPRCRQRAMQSICNLQTAS